MFVGFLLVFGCEPSKFGHTKSTPLCLSCAAHSFHVALGFEATGL